MNKSQICTIEVRNMIEAKRYNYDIACVQEPSCRKGLITNMNRDYIIADNIFRENSQPRAAIYVSREFSNKISKIATLCDHDCAVGELRARDKHGKLIKILIISIYMDGRREIDVDLKKLENILNYSDENGCIPVFSSDCNAWSTDWGSADDNSRGKKLKRFFDEKNIVTANNGDPTFNAGTCIDITFMRQSDNLILNWRLNDEDVTSDHYLISFDLEICKKDPIIFRDPKQIDESRLFYTIERNLMPAEELWDSESCEVTSMNLEDALKKGFEKAAKVIYIRKKQWDSWYTKEMDEERRRVGRLGDRKRELKALAEENNNESTKELLKQCEKRRKYALKKYKQKVKYQQKLHCEDKGQALDTYNKATRAINTKKSCGDKIFETMRKQGQSNVTLESTSELIIDTHFPRRKPLPDFQEHIVRVDPYTDWVKQIVNEKTVRRAIWRFGSYKKPGRDGIYPVIIQKSLDLIILHLIELFRFSLVTGYIPKSWLEIDVIFIPKADKEKYDDPKSYRPISLMSFIMKTLEHLICFHLEDKLENLRKEQYAYRKGRSTVEAINDVVTNIEKNLSNKKSTWALFADIKGAFDSLKHTAITKALKKNNVENEIIKWIEVFLSHREVFTNIAGVESKFCPTDGIPQGAVSACRIWNFCMNELLELLQEIVGIFMAAYSDDLHVETSGEFEAIAQRKMERVLEITDKWCDENGLELQSEKCVFMRFANEKNLMKPTLEFKGKRIEFANKTLYLGCIIDTKLCWKPHLMSMQEKVKKKLNMVLRISGKSWGVRMNIARRIYQTVILPKAFYAACVWYSRAHIGENEKIIMKMHNEAVRKLGSGFEKSSIEILEIAIGILPIKFALKAHVTMEILRLESINQWDTRKRLGHYCINGILDIEKWCKQENDLMLIKKSTIDAVSYCPSKSDWLAGKVKFIDCSQIFFDASVNKSIGRSGVGIYSTDFDIRESEETNQIMSSFKAESYGCRRALDHLIEKDICHMNIACFCDNKELVKRITCTNVNSKIIADLQDKIELLEMKGNILKFVWIPAHQDVTVRAINKEMRMNFIADRLTHGEAKTISCNWKFPLMKKELKREIIKNAWNEALAHYKKSKLKSTMNFKITRLVENKIASLNPLYGPCTGGFVDKNFTLSDLCNFTRVDFFLLTSLMSGQNFLRSYVSKLNAGETTNICRSCLEDVENSYHILQKCPAHAQARLEIFGNDIIDLKDIEFDAWKLLRFIKETSLKEYLIAREEREKRIGKVRWDETIDLETIEEEPED